jgi:hypothetical protein
VGFYAYQRRHINQDLIMSSQPSQPYFLSRLLSAPVVCELRAACRAVGGLLASHHAPRGTPDVHASSAIPGMDDHLLRDIGAHDGRTRHAVARAPAEYRGGVVLQLFAPLLVVLTSIAVSGVPDEAADSPSKVSPQHRMGVFSGEYVDGVPVYQLPSVNVVSSRKAEDARRERERQLSRSQQGRSRSIGRTPA